MTIGILGGGQLARMLSFAAARLGFRTIIFAPEKDCAASKVVGNHIIAAYTDQLALDHFSRHSDVITYESENVPFLKRNFLMNTILLRPPGGVLKIREP
jgi:5-(carboxyamino)imidazole ribonucleotide synthase